MAATIEDNEQVIRNFIAAWSRLDANELVSYFAEDGVYHNVPLEPVSSRDRVHDFIVAFLKDWTSTQWDVLNIVGRDNIVIAERLDRTMVGDKPVNLPCCGVFEMEGGKIKVWRDYFDMGTYAKALA